jgi:hypothetical protein
MLCCGYSDPYMYYDPFGLLVGGNGDQYIWATDDCEGGDDDITDYFLNGVHNWWTGNTAVATASNNLISAVGVGSTTNYASGYMPITREIGYGRQCPNSVHQPSGPVNVALQFNVAYSSYIPTDHVSGPTSCSYQSSSITKIYMGDGGRGTYRTTESVLIIPDSQQSSGFFQDTGQTRNYGYGSPANGSALSAADEDGVANDCYLWNQAGKATPAFSHTESYPSSQHGQVHFSGSSANPLENQLATITWDMTVLLDDSNPASPTAVTTYNHTCYPSHQVKVNGSLAYSYPASCSSTDTLCIFDCLVLHVGTQSGTYGPVSVPNH